MSDKGLVFISYKHEDDTTFALQLRDQLHTWGWRTWMDIFDIPKGAYWPDEVNKGMEAANLVVGIVSPRSVQSRNVKNEWDWAIVYNKPLILIMLENCVVPVNYISLNWIEYHKGAEAALKQLDSALAKKQIITADAAIIETSESLQATATVTNPDPYLPYLQKFYERINKALAERIIKRTDDEQPEPIRLGSSSTPQAVDALFAKQEEIDPVFEAVGIAQNTPKQDYDDFQSAVAYYEGKVLLLGEPGAGKTITLLQFARDAAVRRIQDPTQPLPLFTIIPDWWRRGLPEIETWIAETYGAPVDAAKLMREGRLMLLLDGLDELANLAEEIDPNDPKGTIQFDPRVRFIEMLNKVLSDTIVTSSTHAVRVNKKVIMVIVTCRIEDYERIGKKIEMKGAVTLKKLDAAQIAAYLRDVPGLADVFKDDAEMQQLAETPLLLSLIAYAFKDKQSELAGLRNLREGVLRDALFNAYISERYAYEKRKLPKGQKLPFDLQAELLPHLGWIAMNNANIGTENLMTERDFRRVIGTSKSKSFIQFCQKLNLITNINTTNWRFIHLRLRDMLAHSRAEDLIDDPVAKIRLIALSVKSKYEISIVKYNNSDDKVGGVVTPSVIDYILSQDRAHRPNLRIIRDSLISPLDSNDRDNFLEIIENFSLKDVSFSYSDAFLPEDTFTQSTDKLLLKLDDNEPQERRVAAYKLGIKGDIRALDKLLIALGDSDEKVRENAAEALGKIADFDIITSLKILLTDPIAGKFAADALQQIGNEEGLRLADTWEKEHKKSAT